MSYDNPRCRVTYHLRGQAAGAPIDFGSGTTSQKIKPPPGATAGHITLVHALSQETFTQVTTQAFIQLGSAGDPDKYLNMGLGTLANGEVAVHSANDLPVKSFDLANDEVPALTELVVTFVAPTGGTPAGQAYVDLCIDWH